MSQSNLILNYLKPIGRSITPIKALKLFNCFRLSGRIFELRARGHNIQTAIIEVNGKKIAKYSLR